MMWQLSQLIIVVSMMNQKCLSLSSTRCAKSYSILICVPMIVALYKSGLKNIILFVDPLPQSLIYMHCIYSLFSEFCWTNFIIGYSVGFWTHNPQFQERMFNFFDHHALSVMIGQFESCNWKWLMQTSESQLGCLGVFFAVALPTS